MLNKFKIGGIRWIKVEDRLPNHGERVLINRLLSCRLGDLSKISIGTYYRDSGWVDEEAYYLNFHVDDVTHWMRLPNTPNIPKLPTK